LLPRFVLVIKYKVSEERIKFVIEPVMHIFAICFGLMTAIASLIMGLYNNANLWCWIAVPPPNDYNIEQDGNYEGNNKWVWISKTDEGKNEYGEDADYQKNQETHFYRWMFYYAPLWFCIVFVTGTMVFVYRTVRQRELRIISESESEESVKKIATSPVIVTDMYVNSSSGVSIDNREENRNNDNIANFLQTIASFATASQQAIETSSFCTHAVYKQALYYTLAFYLTLLFGTINRLIQTFLGVTFFPTIFLQCVTVPLQGLFNGKYVSGLVVFSPYILLLFCSPNPNLFFLLACFTYYTTSHRLSILLLQSPETT
jgi:hypothetical protein